MSAINSDQNTSLVTAELRSFGRRRARKATARQQMLVEHVLPRWRLDMSASQIPEPRAIFRNEIAEIWLEIGFGGGEHLVHQAMQNPKVGFIGCEPFVNGVAMCLGKIRRSGVSNVRLHPGDARDLFDVLPDGSVAKAFLLYPDPWPKARHHRRRFVTPEHLDPLARVMAPGAELRVATDIPDYVRQTLEEVPPAGFRWTAEGPTDWRTPWPDWPSTRYEAKALREGRTPHYLTFLRDD